MLTCKPHITDKFLSIQVDPSFLESSLPCAITRHINSIPCFFASVSQERMDFRPKKKSAKTTISTNSEEVSSSEWDCIKMSDQEEDLIYRMYRLVGDRWDLIAGRIPGRKPEEVERFWMMKHGDAFAEKRNQKPAEEADRAKNS